MWSRVGKIIIFLIPFILLFLLLWQKDFEFNEDLGRHIVLGRTIINCHCVPKVNLFSYTYSNFPWFTNSWLSAVIFYETFFRFGKEALLYLKLILISSSFLILYTYAWKKYSKFWTVLISIPLLIIFYFRFGLRPEVFSFLLMSLFIFLIEKYRQTYLLRYLWLLIPLEILWINLHIYFIFGIILYCCLLFEKIIQKKLTKALVLLFVLLLLSTVANPLTYHMAFLPFTIFHNYGGNVLENQSIFTYLQNFGDTNSPYTVSFLLFELMSVLLMTLSFLFVFSKNTKNLSIYYLLISVLGITAAGRMIRFLSLFSLLTFLPFISNVTYIENILLKREGKDFVISGKVLIGILCSILVLMIYITSSQNQILGLAFKENYQEAADFIKNNHIPGPMFNAFNDGAYMTFQLYPGQKVFIDARAEAYPAGFVQKFNNMLADPTIFEYFDQQYKFNYIVFNNEPGFTSKFIKYILSKKEWVPVYVDHVGNIIFLRNAVSNMEFIQQHAVHKKINVIE